MAPVAFAENGIEVDAADIAAGLGLAAAEVLPLMQSGAITALSEKGVGDDAGRYRLTFFHRGRRLRLMVDAEGRIVHRSTVDFGERALPAALRRPGG